MQAAQPLDLTTRQRQVLDFIRDRIAAWGYPPTIREIGEHLRIRSTNGVVDHLKALKRKGYLEQQDLKSRTLRPRQPRGRVETARAGRGAETVRAVFPSTQSVVHVPLLGRVAAGEPILAEEDAQGTVIVDSILVGNGRKLFALKVVGESMIEDGILDGDYIFVRKRERADAGEIVVVMIEGEATVKRFYPEGNRIRLQPANAALKPIFIEKREFKETQILGVVVGVYRKL